MQGKAMKLWTAVILQMGILIFFLTFEQAKASPVQGLSQEYNSKVGMRLHSVTREDNSTFRFTKGECEKIRELLKAQISKIGNAAAVSRRLLRAAYYLAETPIVPIILYISSFAVSRRIVTEERRKLQEMNVTGTFQTLTDVDTVCKLESAPLSLTQKEREAFVESEQRIFSVPLFVFWLNVYILTVACVYTYVWWKLYGKRRYS